MKGALPPGGMFGMQGVRGNGKNRLPVPLIFETPGGSDAIGAGEHELFTDAETKGRVQRGRFRERCGRQGSGKVRRSSLLACSAAER